MKRLFAVCALLAVAACGDLGKDPVAGTTFQAPAGWSATPNVFGVRVVTSSRMDQFIVLESLPAEASFDGVLEGINVRNPRDVVARAVKVCGTMPARETQALVFFKNASTDERLDLLTNTHAGRIDVSAYLYPIGTRPDPAAVASIHELCPAKK